MNLLDYMWQKTSKTFFFSLEGEIDILEDRMFSRTDFKIYLNSLSNELWLRLKRNLKEI